MTRSAIVDELLGRSSTIRPEPKRRKVIVDKQPRRGDALGVGMSKWRIPLPDNVWEELRRPERYDESSWDGKRFVRIYGCPAVIFDQYVKEASLHDSLRGNIQGDGRRGPTSKPLELKVAAVLEAIQAGHIFKTSERLYKISEQVIETFFHEFMQKQVEFEYHKHVYIPEEPAEIAEILHLHGQMGYPGAISQTDGTKVAWLGCPHGDKYSHIGKEGIPTKLFLVSGDARKIIHHVHGSHPGGRNDLTAAHYDEFMQSVHKGRRYANHTFELYTGNGLEKSLHRGLYFVTDNGFHRWRVTQFPSKVSIEKWLLRWSKRLESLRKPGTECIYGIMKKRIRMLALPISFRDTYKVDNLFRFACSLHNRLQRHYGLDKIGQFDSDWALANHSRDDELIAAQQRGLGLPHIVNDAALGNITEAEFQPSWASFRTSLVTHFRVQWEQKQIFWPKTAAECRPGYRTDVHVRRHGDGTEDEERGDNGDGDE